MVKDLSQKQSEYIEYKPSRIAEFTGLRDKSPIVRMLSRVRTRDACSQKELVPQQLIKSCQNAVGGVFISSNLKADFLFDLWDLWHLFAHAIDKNCNVI